MRRSDVAVVSTQRLDVRDVAAFRRAIKQGFRLLKDSDAAVERSRDVLAQAYRRLDRERTTSALTSVPAEHVD